MYITLIFLILGLFQKKLKKIKVVENLVVKLIHGAQNNCIY